MVVDKNSTVPNTLMIPSMALYVAHLQSREDLVEASRLAKKSGLPLLPLGEGSNVVPREKINAFLVIMNNKGVEQKGNYLKAQAGEKWDDTVKFAVSRGLSGIESLSWIPGLTGAAPVQNIGAYGAEIGNVIEQVEVFDTEKEEFKFIKKEECGFEYRNSVFKKNPGKFIVISIVLELSNRKPSIPKYEDIKAYFRERNITNPNLPEIREAVIRIRQSKLPDSSRIPNAGSYFTNPILNKNKFKKIKKEFPDTPFFEAGDKIKIPAGWLIEKAGLKGKEVGKLKTHDKNALILTNPNKESFVEIQNAEKIIKDTIYQKFGIFLEREPVII